MIRPATHRGRPGFSVGATLCRYRATAAAIELICEQRKHVPFTPHDAYWRSKLFWDAVLDRLLMAEREPDVEAAPVVRFRKEDVPRIAALPKFGVLCDRAKRPLALVSVAGVRPATADMLQDIDHKQAARMLLPGALVPIVFLRKLARTAPHASYLLDGGILVVRQSSFRAHLWSPDSICWRGGRNWWNFRDLAV